ncbi:MAG TPA: PAS domain S-box protein [Thermoanaerobaculia bacterium]
MSNPQRFRDFSSAEELAMLVEEVRDYAMFVLDLKGTIRSWNRGAENIMGYSADEAVGRHFSLFYPPDDVARKKPDGELALAAAEGRMEDEGWRIRKDGARFWANTVITALRGPGGELRGFAKVTRDLTERREADERLRQSEELFRLLISSVEEYAIFMLDPTGHITTWNAGARRIKGYAPEEIIGKHFSIFYPAAEKAARKPDRELEIAIREGKFEEEGWRLRKDGSRFWANVLITPVHDGRGELRGFAKVTRDITDRKEQQEMQQALLEQREARLQAEEERRRAEASYRVAQEANRAKDEFLMTLSHELRTPLTAILGWARMLPAIPPGDQAFHDAVAAIARGAQLQATLIDDVLDVSRIISGKLRLTRESIEVERVLNGALDAVRPSAEARSISIVLAFSNGLGNIVGDATRLQQIVWNLLTNAVKFTPKGGIITLAARRTSSHVQISVVDNGEGIDPAFLPHVFEAFRQAESPSTRVHGGLGLGLSIVRYLVEAHGGTVSAESSGRGKGATFTVILPVSVMSGGAITDEPAQVAEAQQRTIDRTQLEGVRILTVDDDREGRELVTAVLRQAGATVTAVESASAALAELTAHRPDVVITDIAMPLMDGYAFGREMRARKDLAGIKLIALTAFPAGAAAAEKSGFDLYLMKPIDPFDLIDAVAGIAGRT